MFTTAGTGAHEQSRRSNGQRRDGRQRSGLDAKMGGDVAPPRRGWGVDCLKRAATDVASKTLQTETIWSGPEWELFYVILVQVKKADGC